MKKKLLFITNHFGYGDGVAKVLLSLINALDKEKYDITLLVFYDFEQEFANLLDKSVKVIKVFGFYFRGLSHVIRKIPTRFWYKHLIKQKYDIEIGFQGGIPIRLVANSLNNNAKHIAWMHGYNGDQTKDFEKCDKVAICAKSTAEKFNKVYKYPERVYCLYNLVNEKELREKAKEKLELQKKYPFTFCTVGRLSPEKGYERLLKCHKRLIDDGLFHNLWIVGDGVEMSKLKKYVLYNNLSDSVKLIGFEKNPYKYIINADCFVCSSFTEGFSTVCTESAVLGTPVLSTLVNGAKELIIDNECGEVTANSEEGLYQGMKDLLKNKDKLIGYRNNLKSPKTPLYYYDRLKEIEVFFDNI